MTKSQTQPPAKKRMGAPTAAPLDDPTVVDELCARIAEGRSMIDVCSDKDMPDARTVYRRMAKDPDFAANIARAREAQQDHETEYMVAIADAATVEDHQVAKLRIWARQWRASKLAPKKYGDKVQTEITGKDGGAIAIEQSGREMVQKAVFLVAKAAKAKK